ncbi:MAG TPA: GNAT family N-acetyltransferase [Xanthomonadales bacterium]|nr:GNAT family N-acetyltransferase [Xanthomonadales bacterium]
MKRDPRIVTDLSTISQQDWDALDHGDNPFLARGFLHALEASGSVTAETGWQPHHLCLYEGARLVAVAPSYLKTHSHGEFVFDWAWADAYQRHGRNYYPKLLTAVPYSPVPGPRLLVQRDHPETATLRRALIKLALAQCEQLDLSSWHCNFVAASDLAALQQADLLARGDWQFHWFNRGYRSFHEFLAQLRAKKRKNMLRDRRLVEQAGIRFVHKGGAELDASDLDFIFACYQQTFLEHGNHPALNRAFFVHLLAELPQSVLAVLARRDGRNIAMSLFLLGGGRLYGRYWGCMEHIPGLHFEAAYHQGIEYCIANGLDVFEPGAQGEHKLSRGFVPVPTHSFHHVRDLDFRTAIGNFLQREHVWLDQYSELLAAHPPYREEE